MKSRFMIALVAGALFGAAPAVAAQEWSMDNVMNAPADWREVPPENLVLMSTTKGDILIELSPEIAPRHVARIREIVAGGLYDGTKFHRVINGFMAQGGDISTIRPDFVMDPVPGEFTFRRNPEEMPMTQLDPSLQNEPYYAGYVNGFPVNSAQEKMSDYTSDGRVESWVPHCPGVVSMARTTDPNSAVDQFFLMRDESPSLDRKYTVWGRMISGAQVAKAMNVGEPPAQPDLVVTARLVSDLPETLRPKAYVMRNESVAFIELIKDFQDAETICQAPSTPAVVQLP